MSFKDTARKIASIPAELASAQRREIPAAPEPEPFREWEPTPPAEDPRRVEFQRALARSTYATGPTVEQVAEAQRRDNAVADAWARQR